MSEKRFKEVLEYSCSYSPASLFTKFSFKQWEIETAKKKDEARKECYYVLSTFMHEWMHHLQFVGTTIGRELLHLLFATGILSRAIKKYVEQGNYARLRRPFIFNYYFDKEFKKNFDLKISSGMFSGLIANAYLGFGPELDDKVPLKSILKNDDIKLKNIEPPQKEEIPLIKIGKKEYYLGSWHIMESFASIHEKIYLFSILKGDKLKEAINAIQFDPYWIIEKYVEQELNFQDNMFWLTRALCDLALNPCFNLKKNEDKWLWEDIHPGWRLVRAVEYLQSKNINKPLSFSKDAIEIKNMIQTALGWIDPWEDYKLQKDLFPWYLKEAIEIRKTKPGAFAFCTENHDYLMTKIQPFVGHAPFPTSIVKEDLSFDTDSYSPAETYDVFLKMAVFGEQVIKLFRKTEIHCPYHNLSFPPNDDCVPGCSFAESFKNFMGITFSEYSKIPEVPK